MNRFHRRTNTLSGGFTLVETMFAIMIMAIALTMVAGAIPVGLEISQDVAKSYQGKTTAHNAVAIVRNEIPHDPGDLPGGNGTFKDETDEITPATLRHQKVEDSDDNLHRDERKGFRVLIKRVNGNANDYLVAIFAYSEGDAYNANWPANGERGNEMAFKKWTSISDLAGDKRSFKVSGNLNRMQPSSIVLGNNGSWGRIESIDGDRVLLDRALTGSDDKLTPIWTIYEHDGNPGRPLPVMSPGLDLLTVRTALRSEQ
jgi:prepilin-type N-terminal cleavage/methylation domain-containing protein